MTQCKNLAIPVLNGSATEFETALASTDVVLDALFGFSFKPPVRAPFDAVLSLLAITDVPILSVDIPSGWDVEHGPLADAPTLKPKALISLTAPKRGVRFFAGEQHWLGGRFVPSSVGCLPLCETSGQDADSERAMVRWAARRMAEEFALDLPRYPSTDQIVEIPVLAEKA